MSEEDRIIILFILTVGYWVLALLSFILSEMYLVGPIANFLLAGFWYHLWRLEREKMKNEKNISYWK